MNRECFGIAFSNHISLQSSDRSESCTVEHDGTHVPNDLFRSNRFSSTFAYYVRVLEMCALIHSSSLHCGQSYRTDARAHFAFIVHCNMQAHTHMRRQVGRGGSADPHAARSRLWICVFVPHSHTHTQIDMHLTRQIAIPYVHVSCSTHARWHFYIDRSARACVGFACICGRNARAHATLRQSSAFAFNIIRQPCARRTCCAHASERERYRMHMCGIECNIKKTSARTGTRQSRSPVLI